MRLSILFVSLFAMFACTELQQLTKKPLNITTDQVHISPGSDEAYQTHQPNLKKAYNFLKKYNRSNTALRFQGLMKHLK